jgi:hypothetical protein
VCPCIVHATACVVSLVSLSEVLEFHGNAGTVGAVVQPIAGVTAGAVQIVRGAINTPDAILQASESRVTNQHVSMGLYLFFCLRGIFS